MGVTSLHDRKEFHNVPGRGIDRFRKVDTLSRENVGILKREIPLR